MRRTLALFILLAGCSHAIQTTSGAAFIAKGPIETDIAAIAAIEPNLHFPAKIGVARMSTDNCHCLQAMKLPRLPLWLKHSPPWAASCRSAP